jgi:hypothetical protein
MNDLPKRLQKGVAPVRRAFAASFAQTPIEWDCNKGMHFPAFMLRTWACSQCGIPLDERARGAT